MHLHCSLECCCVWQCALLHPTVHMRTYHQAHPLMIASRVNTLWMCNIYNDNNALFPPSAVPTITNPLIFTPGSPSSTLTCISSTSVATNVTFMREGSPIVGLLRDGDSTTMNGITYQLAQTLTDRRQSTYENVLTITEERSSLVGSAFTCRVKNVLGMSETSQSFEIPGKKHGLGKYKYLRSKHKVGQCIAGKFPQMFCYDITLPSNHEEWCIF